MLYWKTGNRLLRLAYPGRVWSMPKEEKKIYLTFDDGPHPHVTPYVLDTIRQYNAKATFFCIGKNVKANLQLYENILKEGHITANHTMTHVDGWKTDDKKYLQDVSECAQWVDGKLFRPPYGKLTSFQSRLLQQQGYQVIMWSVLSGDFDIRIDGKQCWDNVRRHTQNGSIIVFHDSEKAYDRLTYALPRVLETFSAEGFTFEAIRMDSDQKIRKQ